MKRMAANLTLSVVAFVSCLVLTEMFFRFNARQGWISPKEAEIAPLNTNFPKEERLPKTVLQDVQRRYADFQRPNEDIADKLSHFPNNKQTSTPIWAADLARRFEQFPDIREIHNRMINLTHNRVIYNAYYGMDHRGRRRLPHQEISKYKPNMIFVGCSFTFGTGVNDAYTMPTFMKHRYPEYNVYNLGIPAGGLNDSLDDIVHKKRLEDINDQGGVVIYSFIYDHLERTFCSLNCYREERRSWALRKSDYDFDKEGKLVNLGRHDTSNPYKAFFYSILAKSAFLDFIGFEKSKKFGVEDEKKFVRLLLELKKFYENQGYDFYFYPVGGARELTETLTQELRQHGVKLKIYDTSSIHEWKERGVIAGDGHLNELGNYLLAAQIHQMLLAFPPKTSTVQSSK
ncbi:hypothetical protein [Pseudobdellovibrio exovorus]|uniref:SGNH/GDSL hydrolase family protein n=1 Tax=Pseudobdellovibrio exovorus JSS TaxID=1184267 RepID=M4V4Y1_9BACT|nr:hypothetical protein [Pseudobdellovibrio exovorus]AGH94397.1 hypothetical protein A11Q_177 [Pseudobdellovibrio exovorus JSS]